MAVYRVNNTPKARAGTCTSSACMYPIPVMMMMQTSELICLGVHASSEILYNLSPIYKEIDPCTDFELLTCGGWDDRHDLRPDQGDAFTGTIMSENSQMLLRHILEAPYPDESKVCSIWHIYAKYV